MQIYRELLPCVPSLMGSDPKEKKWQKTENGASVTLIFTLLLEWLALALGIKEFSLTIA